MPPTTLNALTSVTGAATNSARLVATLAVLPVRLAGAVLDSPRVARHDPASHRLADLRHGGWRTAEVRLAARSAEADVTCGDERQVVEGSTMAFAAYATRAALRDGAPVLRRP